MPLLFRSSQGPWSVHTCRCCGDPVKFTNSQEVDWVGDDPHVYIAHHAPLGTPWERKGEMYDFIAEAPESPAVAFEKSAPLTTGWEEKTQETGTGSVQWWCEEDS